MSSTLRLTKFLLKNLLLLLLLLCNKLISIIFAQYILLLLCSAFYFFTLCWLCLAVHSGEINFLYCYRKP